ncbi:MAG TPA: hypothetical protein VGS08_05435 [Candidatus Saccharimonadales bacterium]|nr:hypothetical protein [Candidatus Saccharimonadales bacterium]
MDTDTTLNELIAFLNRQPGSRPKAIAEGLGVSRQYVQKLLADNKKKFTVTGLGPNRFYRNATLPHESTDSFDSRTASSNLSAKDRQLIEDNFYSLTPLGEELTGVQGLAKWSQARNFDIKVKQNEYLAVLRKYYPPGFKSPIDFTNKVKRTLNEIALEKVWAIDYYNFEIFGKTKLGTQVLVAKQTGDMQTTRALINKLATVTDDIVSKYKIQAVAFVSPTIQRQSQLMTRLEGSVALKTPRIKVHKVGARILIAQKTLKSLADRVLNAAQTFVVESPDQYENILIIDDALGSGATLNEMAKQIKQKRIARQCYGLVLVSSPSGYEVINEV